MRSTQNPSGAATAPKRKHPFRRLLLAAVAVFAVVALWSGIFGGEHAGGTETLPASYVVPEVVPAEAGKPLVCIDPGHGGTDRGSTSGGRDEANDNLAMALALREELLRRGIGVAMTRTSDVSVALKNRPAIANSVDADYFISLHRNAVESGSAQGIEVWHSRRAGAHTLSFADHVENALLDAGVTKSRGCRGGSAGNPNQDYAVCRLTEMPAVLVELGFLTDWEDNQLFDEHQADYASALADAVEEAWAEKLGN